MRPRQNGRHVIYDTLKFVFIALLIITPFRFYVAQPFIVSGASMAPTLEPNEYLVIDELTYQFEQPKRGDVIIFRYPLDPSIFFVKRIVGLPGETVDIQGGVVSVRTAMNPTDHQLLEPYAASKKTDAERSSITLADNEYFVMGDNRDQSSDSRIWGPVQKKFIIGRAFIRLYPFDRTGILPGAYGFPETQATH